MRNSLALLLLVSGLITLSSCVSPSGGSNVSKDDLLPTASVDDAQIRATDGSSHSISQIVESDGVTVLVFWQPWCGSCKVEAPKVEKAAQRLAGKIAFYGVVSGPDEAVDAFQVEKFIRDTGISYPQLRDVDLTLTRRYDVKGTPTIVALAPGGRVIYNAHRPPARWEDLVDQGRTRGTASRIESDGTPFLHEQTSFVMGTELTISVIGTDKSLLERATAAAIAEMERVENLMTDWRTSPLTRLNDMAGSGAVATDPEIVKLVGRAGLVSELTSGAFDVTYASAGQLWKFKKGQERIPTDAEIEAALVNVNASRVTVDLEAGTLTAPSGVRIGLGGIAKGYGVDRAMNVLRDHGIKNAVVNAGGDMKVLGKKFGQPWEIAIKHPRRTDHALAVLQLSNTCCVTSGDYERFFEVDGVRYHHIIDPRSGRPSTGAMSATVIAPDAAFADSLATALCVLGPKEGLPIIESLERVEALVIDLDEEVHASSGLSAWANNFEDYQ